jgi:Ca2+-dependent lipid-binding protein
LANSAHHNDRFLGVENLAAADANGLSDPFCEISSTFSKQKFRSQVINKNLNPKWNETYEFYTTSTKGFLFFKLYDKDFIGKDFLGDVAIKTNDLNDGKPQEGWYKLSNEPKSKKGDVGEVLLRVHFPIPAPAKVEEVKQVKKKKKERRKAQIRDFYEIGKVLGRGGFSVVKEGTNKSTGEKVAIKILSKVRRLFRGSSQFHDLPLT